MADFTQMRRELQQQIRITGRRAAIEWESQVEQAAPVDTGELRRSVHMEDRPSADGVTITGEVNVDYAEVVSTGSRPHPIRARRAKALKFNVNGQTLFRVSVQHPGTQPNPYWTGPLQRLPDTIQAIWRRVTA